MSVISTTVNTNDCVAHQVMKKVLFSSGLTPFLSHNTNVTTGRVAFLYFCFLCLPSQSIVPPMAWECCKDGSTLMLLECFVQH